MSKTIKCGDYMMKDGVVFYRPGKKFRVPDMPEEMKIPYPDEKYRTRMECENIEQMNALSNQQWKRDLMRQHRQMELMFIRQVLRQQAKRPVVCVKKGLIELKDKIHVAMALYSRSRND